MIIHVIAMSAASTPKIMSSRLLTMKFMQRAANTPTTPPTPDEPSPKRRKTESSSPTKLNVDALADRSAIQAAIASEEAKRQAALEKQATEAGDTRWVLSFEDQKQFSSSPSMVLRVVPTGFANIDASPSQAAYLEDANDKPVMVGRRSFGKFNRVIERQQDPSLEESSESESDSEAEEEDSEDSESDEFDPTTQMINAERRQAAERAKNERMQKKRAAKAESEQLGKRRRKETPAINLNKLTSLSGTNQDRPAVVPAGMKCFNCGGHHFRKDCPNTSKRGHEGVDDGRPRKSQKHR